MQGLVKEDRGMLFLILTSPIYCSAWKHNIGNLQQMTSTSLASRRPRCGLMADLTYIDLLLSRVLHSEDASSKNDGIKCQMMQIREVDTRHGSVPNMR